MYLGTQEISTIEWNLVTFTNWNTFEITEKNKELITEEAITWSEFQEKWAKQVAIQIIDLYFQNNVRLVDINLINSFVWDIINNKNDETLVNLLWKEKLDTISNIMWAKESLASLAVRNIRVKDIFNS